MFYATHEYDSSLIESNANIQAFETLEQAREWLLKPYDATEWDHETAVIEPGRFGDCWVRSSSPPQEDDGTLSVGVLTLRPFKADQLYVAQPGTHPGGKVWWITPSEDVLIVSHIEERS